MFVRFQPLEVRTTGKFGLACVGFHGVDNWAVYRNINIAMDSMSIGFVLPAQTNGSDMDCDRSKVVMIYTYFEVVLESFT